MSLFPSTTNTLETLKTNADLGYSAAQVEYINRLYFGASNTTINKETALQYCETLLANDNANAHEKAAAYYVRGMEFEEQKELRLAFAEFLKAAPYDEVPTTKASELCDQLLRQSTNSDNKVKLVAALTRLAGLNPNQAADDKAWGLIFYKLNLKSNDYSVFKTSQDIIYLFAGSILKQAHNNYNLPLSVDIHHTVCEDNQSDKTVLHERKDSKFSECRLDINRLQRTLIPKDPHGIWLFIDYSLQQNLMSSSDGLKLLNMILKVLGENYHDKALLDNIHYSQFKVDLKDKAYVKANEKLGKLSSIGKASRLEEIFSLVKEHVVQAEQSSNAALFRLYMQACPTTGLDNAQTKVLVQQISPLIAPLLEKPEYTEYEPEHVTQLVQMLLSIEEKQFTERALTIVSKQKLTDLFEASEDVEADDTEEVLVTDEASNPEETDDDGEVIEATDTDETVDDGELIESAEAGETDDDGDVTDAAESKVYNHVKENLTAIFKVIKDAEADETAEDNVDDFTTRFEQFAKHYRDRDQLIVLQAQFDTEIASNANRTESFAEFLAEHDSEHSEDHSFRNQLCEVLLKRHLQATSNPLLLLTIFHANPSQDKYQSQTTAKFLHALLASGEMPLIERAIPIIKHNPELVDWQQDNVDEQANNYRKNIQLGKLTAKVKHAVSVNFNDNENWYARLLTEHVNENSRYADLKDALSLDVFKAWANKVKAQYANSDADQSTLHRNINIALDVFDETHGDAKYQTQEIKDLVNIMLKSFDPQLGPKALQVIDEGRIEQPFIDLPTAGSPREYLAALSQFKSVYSSCLTLLTCLSTVKDRHSRVESANAGFFQAVPETTNPGFSSSFMQELLKGFSERFQEALASVTTNKNVAAFGK